MPESVINKWAARIVHNEIVCRFGVFAELGDNGTYKCLDEDIVEDLDCRFFADSELSDNKLKALELLHDRLTSSSAVIVDDLSRVEKLRYKVAQAWMDENET